MERTDIQIRHIAEFHRWMEGDALSEKAKQRLRCILHYFENNTSIAEASAAYGMQPGALRRWLDRFDPNDASSLEEKTRRPGSVRTTSIPAHVAALIRDYRVASPKMGKEDIALALKRDHDVHVSASAIGRLIERDCLYFGDSPLHTRKRLMARLEMLSSQTDVSQTSHSVSETLNAVRGKRKWFRRGSNVWKRVIAACFVVVLLFVRVPVVHGETTPLVNTESFQTIDGGSQTTDVELRFGNLTGEKLFWDVLQSRFDFTDDLHVQDNLTGSGGLAIEQNIRAKGDMTINSNNAAADATFTFGNSVLAQTLKFAHASQKFRFSTSLDVVGTMSGYALTVSALRNCDTIDTDSNGVMSCGTDGGAGGGLSQTDADARYLRLAGGTMTGSITVLRASNMTVSGAIVYSSGSSLRQNAKGASGQVLISQGTAAPKWANPVGGMIWYFDGTQSVTTSKGPQITMPFGLTLSGVTLKAKGAPTGAALIYNIKKDGVTIFSTRPQINAGATTGGTTAVLSTTVIPVNSVLTLDVDQVGSTFAGSGVTIQLTGTRKY